MNELEIIFSMLGEKVTTEITINKDARVLVNVLLQRAGWRSCRKC